MTSGRKAPRGTVSKSPSGRRRRKAPPWVTYFLRSLARTGEARAAALDAGVDHSTAYARRRAHADFAAAWQEALTAHAVAKALAEEEEIAVIRAKQAVADPSTIRSLADGPPPHPSGREELIVSGGQVKRAGHDRWSKRKERIFFDELAATNNIHRSAAAAGVSYNAVNARRLRHPLFAAKWDAVVDMAKASINMHLLEVANDAFDPAKLAGGHVQPKVTVAEAIRIVQIGAAKKQAPLAGDPFAQQAPASSEELDERRERLVRKFIRLRQRETKEKLAQGWAFDEEHKIVVPPGWVRDCGSQE